MVDISNSGWPSNGDGEGGLDLNGDDIRHLSLKGDQATVMTGDVG